MNEKNYDESSASGNDKFLRIISIRTLYRGGVKGNLPSPKKRVLGCTLIKFREANGNGILLFTVS